MTLSSETVRTSYDGDDATTAFSTVFVFWDDSDVRVVHRDSSDTETVYVKGTHYTLTGGSGAVGTVTTKSGFTVATGEKLIIISARANTQATSFATGGSFPSANAEKAIDQITRMVQQDAEELGRALTFSETSPDSDITFPDVTDNADKIFQINSAGTGISAVTFASLSAAELTSPVTLANGGTSADLSSPTAEDIIRINAGGTAMEGRSIIETVGDLFAKGADIASADPLVIGSDGHYFDVTGTTTFDEQTVAAGRLYILQFDGALTMTDDADHDLGGANITTAAGDRGLFYATAANTVQLISWIPEGSLPDKTVLDLEFVSTAAITAATTLEVTGLAAGYDYIITLEAFAPTDDGEGPWMRFSDDAGVSYEADAGDYSWGLTRAGTGELNDSDTEIQPTGTIGVGNDATNDCTLQFTLINPNASSEQTTVFWQGHVLSTAATPSINAVVGSARFLQGDDAVDAVQFLWSGGSTFKAQGDISVWRRKRS